MEFIKLDTTKTGTQNLRIFNSNPYDLNCSFDLDSNKNITSLTISMDDLNRHKHEIKSALICKNTIDGNNTFYYLLVNMERGTHKRNITLKPGDQGYPSSIKMGKGDIIFVDSYEYDSPNDEIDLCSKINIFDYDINPKHKKGNIIVGNP